MKLIRLTSTENKAMFDNTFNDPISLPANAQVALANVALASEPRSVAIDADNGLVTWTTESSDEVITYENTLTMDAGVYNAGTQQTFMDNLEGDLNDNQETENWNLDTPSHAMMMNTQWTVVENTGNPNVPGQPKKTVDDKKIVIGYRKACTSWLAQEPDSTASPLAKDFVSLNTTIDTSDKYNMVNRTTGAGDEDSYLMAHQPMTWGPGGFAFNLNTISKNGTGPAADLQGVFFGLTTVNHAISKPTTKPTRAECKFGVHCSYADTVEKFVIYKSGVATTTNKVIVSGMNVLIRRDKGILEAYSTTEVNPTGIQWNKLKDTSNQDISLEWNNRDNASSPLYPVVIFYGDAFDTVIEKLSYAPDPYKYFTWRQGKNQLNDCLWDLAPLSPGNKQINFKMELSSDVAVFLGFMSGGLGDFKFPARPAKLQLVNSTDFGWKAIRSWATVGISESFYVQLLSSGCEGYDGLTSGRKNILAVIPKSDDSNLLLYDVANPLFLEIGNAFPITLRNISARVLTEDGGELPTDGLSVMTLLFK